jgi:CRISPR-associated protein Cas1
LNPLLVSGFGNFISVDKRKLVIQNKLENTRLEFYPHQISHDSIVIDGHTGNITFEAIRWLMKHDISITLLNWNGNLLGVTLPQGPKAGRLRVLQYNKYLDQKARYDIAAKIVEQKVANSYNLLKELSRYYDILDVKLIAKTFAAEEVNYKQNHAGKNVNNLLMMYEGRVATFYWDCLAKVFNKLYPNFHFKSRKNKSYSWNMNASDEINALLNYGYAILESEVRKDINAVGLDPAVGFLHDLAESKEPLVYDMQELFRWLVDLSVIQLLEEKKLRKSDFIVTENYHVRLKEQTAKALIERIKLNMNAKAVFKSRNATYQTILFENIRALAAFAGGKTKTLSFGLQPLAIRRNDTVDLRQHILSISPAERKRLGINKSTLWYQKKKVSEGRAVKIYSKVIARFDGGEARTCTGNDLVS